MLDPSRPLLPQLPDELGMAERLRSVVKRVGSHKFIALTQISKAQLNRYLKGAAVPSDRLAAIALAGEVSLDWLVRGDDKVLPCPTNYQQLGDLTQLFFEIVRTRFDGHAWKPSELKNVIPLLLMNASYVSRQGSKWEANSRDMLDCIHYLDGMRRSDMLETYLKTLDLISTNQGLAYEETWAGPFCNIVNTGLKHYYNSEAAYGYFDRVDQGLGLHNLQWVRSFIEQYAALQTPGKTGKLLDVGCGSGRYLAYFHANYDSMFEVFGVEQADYALGLCNQHIKATRLRPGCVKQGDILNLDYEPNSFEAVVSYLTLHYFPYVKHSPRYGVGKVLSEIYRVLKPGGLAHIVIPRDTVEEFLPVYSVSHPPVRLFEILTQLGANIRDCSPFERQHVVFPGNTIPNNLERFYAISFSKPL